MPRRITGLPRGMVPQYRPPADMSRYLDSFRRVIRSLERDISDAEWRFDFAKADQLRRILDLVRREQRDARTDHMPLF